jgi:urea transport system permease protein
MRGCRSRDLSSMTLARPTALTGMRDALLRFVMAVCVMLFAATASAQDLGKAVERFAADSFSDTEAAIADVIASGAPHAAAILEALGDRRLLVTADKKIIYKDAAGKAFDAATGAETPGVSGEPVRLNNRLRGVVSGAIGSLTLMAPDPRRRLDAANSVFRNRDATALPVLQDALAKETDPKVRKAFAEARAAILLTAKDASEVDKVQAAQVMAGRTSQDGLALLRQVSAEATGPLKVLVDQGIGDMERRQQILEGARTLWFGLSLGSVLLLAAIGLAITFGVMGVINMAHGEMVMIGAYVTFMVQEVIRTKAPQLFDWSLPIAIPLAFLVAGAVGILIERGVIRFLYGRPLETLLATFGVSLILQQAVRTWFGPTNREVGAPSYMSGSFDLYGLEFTYARLWIVVFTLVVFAALLLVLKATPLGLQMRAVTQNRRMASSMGIRTRFVDAMTFGLGSGIAGIAGVALSQIDNVSPNLGQSYIIDSFMVVVFGGVGNLWGTLLGAFILGIANKLLEPFAGAVLGKIIILVLIILFIQKRPRGMFALKGRAVEQ